MRKLEVKQAKDGTLRYKVRFRLNGMQSSQTFDIEQDAQEFAQLLDDFGPDAALRYLDNRTKVGASEAMTLTKWFEQYTETLTGIEERTRVDYRRVYKRHIEPTLGTYPLGAIDSVAVATLINKLDKDGRSGKTIANIHGILSASLNAAVADRKIALDHNPCKGMRLPRGNEAEIDEAHFLTHAEYNALEDVLADKWPRWVPLVRTLVGTGMRWSEATALRVGEVDLEGLPTIRIIRSTKWVPGEGHKDGVPKTKKSRRTIIAPPQVVEVIAPLLEGRARDDLVFTAVRGGRVRHSAFYRLVWRKAWREVALAGVDQDDPKAVAAALDKYGDFPRIHDLRHTFASWAIEMGIGLEAIQDQLGHESILTTRKIYGHLQPAMREALADAMYRALAQGRLPVEEVPRLDP